MPFPYWRELLLAGSFPHIGESGKTSEISVSCFRGYGIVCNRFR